MKVALKRATFHPAFHPAGQGDHTWTIGPSRPAGNPQDTHSPTPIDFKKRVLRPATQRPVERQRMQIGS